MPTNRRNMGILIIILGLILIILIIYFGFLKKSESTISPSLPTATTTVNLPTNSAISSSTPRSQPPKRLYNLSKNTPHQVGANDLGKIAMAFSERLGSFSNQSSYSNITDLEILMTKNMRTWAKTYIPELRAKYKNNGTFYGITTHALTFTVKSFADQKGRAQIIVTTQRQVQSTNKTYNQKIDLNFLKVKGEWLVDQAYWER